MPIIGTATGSFWAGMRLGIGAYIPPSPSDPSLASWYDASTSTDFNPSNPVSGTSLNNWNDHSANGRNLGTTGTGKPSYFTNVQNGSGAVFFNGTTYRLDASISSVLNSKTNATLVVVAKPLSAGGNQAITAASNTSTPISGYYLNILNNTWRVAMANGVASVSGITVDTNAHVHTILYDGSQTGNARLTYRQDGKQLPLSFITTPASATGATINQFNVGREANGTNYYLGNVCEIFIYTATLSGTTLYNVETYALNKWNIARAT